MTQPMDDLLQMAVEAELSNATGGIEGDGGCYYDYSDEIKRFAELVVKKAVEAALATAWDEGYAHGIKDERTSEASIGIAGFGAKVEPARQNPYGYPAQPAKPAQPPADLESAVINAARSAMDESYEAGNKACDIVVLNHLAATLSLCIDDYDRNIKEQNHV